MTVILISSYCFNNQVVMFGESSGGSSGGYRWSLPYPRDVSTFWHIPSDTEFDSLETEPVTVHTLDDGGQPTESHSCEQTVTGVGQRSGSVESDLYFPAPINCECTINYHLCQICEEKLSISTKKNLQMLKSCKSKTLHNTKHLVSF